VFFHGSHVTYEDYRAYQDQGRTVPHPSTPPYAQYVQAIAPHKRIRLWISIKVITIDANWKFEFNIAVSVP
jgi:hypothetical protein